MAMACLRMRHDVKLDCQQAEEMSATGSASAAKMLHGESQHITRRQAHHAHHEHAADGANPSLGATAGSLAEESATKQRQENPSRQHRGSEPCMGSTPRLHSAGGSLQRPRRWSHEVPLCLVAQSGCACGAHWQRRANQKHVSLPCRRALLPEQQQPHCYRCHRVCAYLTCMPSAYSIPGQATMQHCLPSRNHCRQARAARRSSTQTRRTAWQRPTACHPRTLAAPGNSTYWLLVLHMQHCQALFIWDVSVYTNQAPCKGERS